MHVALNRLREVVIQNTLQPAKVDTSGHHFRANHHPSFASSHPRYTVFSLFRRHLGVEDVYGHSSPRSTGAREAIVDQLLM